MKPVRGAPNAKNEAVMKSRANSSRLIIYFKALGLKNKDIATQLGVSAETVGRTLRSPVAQEELARVQQEIIFKQPIEMFRTLLPAAVKVVAEIMMSKRASSGTRLVAAEKIMDRALGKPTQEIKQEVSNIRDLIDALDRQERDKPTIDLNADWWHPVDDSKKEESGGGDGRNS